MEYAEEDKPSSFYLFEFRFVYENMFTLFNAVGLQQTLAKRGGGRRGPEELDWLMIIGQFSGKNMHTFTFDWIIFLLIQ